VPFTLLYHPAVGDEDIPKIPRNLHRRIAGAIESRLTQAPHQYGAPLRKTLKGYWKLRVGDYRVVYKIDEHEILILGIQHRKSVYEDILQRVGPGKS
jgi:mRNA interferase RelE/StbE